MDQAKLPAGLTVLLVEDDLVNQIVMEAVLRDLGVQALMAGSGEQALDLLEQRSRRSGAHGLPYAGDGRPDDHAPLARKEARLQRPRVPVIGLTGDVYSGAREACVEAGMDDYLTKPASALTSVR